ncbi:MAG: beta-galactosidase domain 4-containing protein, partial [Halanaerobiales bacterium]
WLEVYRDKSLDLEGDQLSISLWVYPESREDCSVITKGNYQFGVEQRQNKLIFYLGGKNRVTLKADLPAHWEKKWHHIAGIYDGETINLYLDGKQVSTRSWQQKLKNTPFPINIGKNAETQGQDHPGKLFAGKIDQVRIIDKAIPADKLYSDKDISPEKALLWLDFERSDNKGYFYSLGIGARSYGLVWPDRRVKPELWQLKKSAQPVSIIPVNLEQGKFKITNRHHFKNLNDLKGNWKLSANGVNGEVLEKGELDIDLEAGKKKIIKIPYKIPDNDKKDYYFLVKFALKNDTLWAKSGHEIAWEQFEVTSAQSEQFMENSSVNDITELSLKQDNAIVHIQGDNFSCNFDKTSGFLTSLKYREQELIKQGPKFNVWRAPVANELDEWPMYRTETAYLQKEMGNNIAGGWRSIGLNKLTHELVQFSVKENDETIEIAAEYMVSGNNYISGFKTGYHYIVNSGGKITLNLKVIPYGNMTGWLPKIGTIMKLPRELQQIKWYGKGPFENYPDRKTGAKTGIFESKVKEEYQPYLIPQDYGNKTEVKWFTISSKKGNGLLVTSKEKLNISSHQYELYNLSRANYPFQLKKSDSVILNIDHNVSGVGGTSISVQDKYKILPQKDEYTFSIIPGNFNK